MGVEPGGLLGDLVQRAVDARNRPQGTVFAVAAPVRRRELFEVFQQIPEHECGTGGLLMVAPITDSTAR